MPETREIEVYLIAKTAIEAENIDNWLKSMGVDEDVRLKLLSPDNSDADILVACAAKQCYMSFQPDLNPNLTRTRSDMIEFIDNVLKQGHGSVLEHVSFTFAVNNVSRVFTGEMNRHRAGVAISERSMRYIRFDETVPYWVPLCIRAHGPLNPLAVDEDLERRKDDTRHLFKRAFEQMEANYRDLVEIWDMDESHHNFHYKKTMTSMFRRIIGMGACTGGVWTLNVRALRHVLQMRCSVAAEEEISLVAHMMLSIMKHAEPKLFGDFDIEGKPKYSKV